MITAWVVEQCLNQAVLLDPETRAKLPELAGHVIRIDCIRPACQYDVVFRTTHISCHSPHHEPPSLTVRGRASQFLDCLYAKQRGSFNPSGLQFEGDIEFAHQLQNLVNAWQGDLGSILAPYLGESGASYATTAQATLRQTATEGLDAFLNHLTSYLQYESGTLVHDIDYCDFKEQLAQLRDGIARLSARVDLIKQRDPTL